MSRDFKIEGLEELKATVKRIGKLPQKCVNRAVKNGGQYALERLKEETHFKDSKGYLKKGLGLKPEKYKKRGKKGIQVTFKKSYTKIFTSPPIEDIGRYGGDPRGRFYYPASVEFGRRGLGGKRPKNFMLDSADRNSTGIKKRMVEVLDNELKKEEAKNN